MTMTEMKRICKRAETEMKRIRKRAETEMKRIRNRTESEMKRIRKRNRALTQTIRPRKRAKTQPKPLVRKFKLEDQVAGKSLFLCTMDSYWDRPNFRPPPAMYQPWDASYIVQSINLSDLLMSSSSDENLKLRELARMGDKDFPGKDLSSRQGLPGRVGCGVLGSKIVFASGLKPNFGPNRFGPPFGPGSSRDAYAFDVNDPKQGIAKMPGELNGGKDNPLVFEFTGKLYVLSLRWDAVPFEVYDPKQGAWSVLPSHPDARGCYPSSIASYVIVGTKLFISSSFVKPTECSTFCFDFVAQEWRKVPSLGQVSGQLPFDGQALAVDTEHSNKELLFSTIHVYSHCKLVVHLMSLDENQESISEIFEMELPDELPCQPFPTDCHFFHLGGNNVLLVTTKLGERTNESGIYTSAALLFQFEFDISKVDTDMKNCFTVQFHPPYIFEYHTSPDCVLPPETLGCFLL